MTGPLVAVLLLCGGIAALYGIISLIAPTSLRRRPSIKTQPHILGGEFNSGRGGHSTVWSVPREEQQYAKIWSKDRQDNQGR